MDTGVENQLKSRSLDLVVGIPSYNEADNIDFVVHQVSQGLDCYFPDLDTAIVNTDNFSQDGTRLIARGDCKGQKCFHKKTLARVLEKGLEKTRDEYKRCMARTRLVS